MVTLIIGKKGSGKTKKLIDATNNAAKTVNGNVVFIEPKEKMIREIVHEARYTSLEQYSISDADELYGFISGICASNYDVEEIFVDSVLRVIGELNLASFIEKIQKLANLTNTKITFTVSAAEDEIPKSVKAIANIDA